jgi:hypothetical protein
MVRSVLAFKVRAARGNRAIAATGALGISNRICATAGRVRRIATSIPPALTFNEVANSRNSLPFPSRLRTKTGIANGNRAHFRRSLRDLAPFMQTSPLAPLPETPNCTSGAISYQKTQYLSVKTGIPAQPRRPNPKESGRFQALYSYSIRSCPRRSPGK